MDPQDQNKNTEPIVETDPQIPATETPQKEEGKEPKSTTVAPKVLTVDEFEKRMKQFGSETQRLIQSSIDKGSNRVEKKVQERLTEVDKFLNLMKELGIQISDGDARSLKNNAALQVLAEAEKETPSGSTAMPQAQRTPASTLDDKTIADTAFSIMHGIVGEDVVVEADPEYELLKKNFTTPQELYAAIATASHQKALRLGLNKEQPKDDSNKAKSEEGKEPESTPTVPGAVSTGSSTGLPDNLSAMDYLRKAGSKKR